MAVTVFRAKLVLSGYWLAPRVWLDWCLSTFSSMLLRPKCQNLFTLNCLLYEGGRGGFTLIFCETLFRDSSWQTN